MGLHRSGGGAEGIRSWALDMSEAAGEHIVWEAYRVGIGESQDMREWSVGGCLDGGGRIAGLLGLEAETRS
jgi:hypothetical protein